MVNRDEQASEEKADGIFIQIGLKISFGFKSEHVFRHLIYHI